MRKYWIILAGLFTGLFCKATDIDRDAHRSLTIYQIMVASFQHGDGGAPGYTQMWGPDGHTKNGNLKGIIQSLDHIASIGANAIWLTPVFDSSEAFGGEKLQATGYFANDFFTIDPHFGTEEEFRHLVDEAHARGLYVILDGVFGHHGGVTAPSPGGHTIDATPVYSDRGEAGGKGNVSYPGSLDYFKEVATYWMEKYGVDGWRLDQCYQAVQGGHNYWKEIRRAVEKTAAERRKRGEKWGTLGYMVGEDWGSAIEIADRSLKQGGLVSVFDFDGKELISGPMADAGVAGLQGGWDDIVRLYSSPSERHYPSDSVMPNLFISNHDGYRAADHIATDSLLYPRMMTLHGILAAYPGPITLYYGDEFADTSIDTTGGAPDNISRTSGHITPRDDNEARLMAFVAEAMKFRRDHPAMWRGRQTFRRLNLDDADILIVEREDDETADHVFVVFADSDFSGLELPGVTSLISGKAWVPLFLTTENASE